jgi:hypothetical protein
MLISILYSSCVRHRAKAASDKEQGLCWKCAFHNHLSRYPPGIKHISCALVDGIRQTNNQTLDGFRVDMKVMRRLQQ